MRAAPSACLVVCGLSLACAEAHHGRSRAEDEQPIAQGEDEHGKPNEAAPVVAPGDDVDARIPTPEVDERLPLPAPAGPTAAPAPTVSGAPAPVEMRPCAVRTFDSLAPNALLGRLSACAYDLGKPLDDPRYLRVYVAGTLRRHEDASDGWRVQANPRVVSLLGAACSEAEAGTTVRFQAECVSLPLR